MVAQLVEDLVHLERGGQGLDQHRDLDGPIGDAQRGLGEDEHLVPEPGLQMALHLRQVEIGAGAGGDLGLGVVEEVEAEIEQRAGHLLAVDPHMALGQMPAPRAHHQGREPAMQGKFTPADGCLTGVGRIDGRRVACIAYDFTVMAGSIGMRSITRRG